MSQERFNKNLMDGIAIQQFAISLLPKADQDTLAEFDKKVTDSGPNVPTNLINSIPGAEDALYKFGIIQTKLEIIAKGSMKYNH